MPGAKKGTSAIIHGLFFSMFLRVGSSLLPCLRQHQINGHRASYSRKVRRLSHRSEKTSTSACETDGLDRIDLDKQKSVWLVVGDGDFSFGATQAAQLSKDGDTHTQLIVSVLEAEEEHNSVYKNSLTNSATIKNNGYSALFGVDATKLEKRFPAESIDRVSFNFPHWPGKANNRYNRELLSSFLCSATKVLKKSGEIHVPLCSGQGGQDAKSTTDWRLSWTASMYAAQCGLLLRRIEDFKVEYDLSSHRGVDRPFTVGEKPKTYVFSLSNGEPIPSGLQLAFRHELRLILDDTSSQNAAVSVDELRRTDRMQTFAQELAPEGIRVSVPIHDIVQRQPADSSLLVFLMVYSGEVESITRVQADSIRALLEQNVIEKLGYEVAKRNRMVSKAFPFPLIDVLIEEHA